MAEEIEATEEETVTTTERVDASEGNDKRIRAIAKQVADERARAEAAEARIKEFETAAQERERKAKEADATADERAKMAEERMATADERAAKAEKRWQDHVDSVKASNKERVDALPEDLRDLVPDDLDPIAMQKQLSRIEAKLKPGPDGRPGMFADGARPPTSTPKTKEKEMDELRKRARDVQLGRVDNSSRGVQR